MELENKKVRVIEFFESVEIDCDVCKVEPAILLLKDEHKTQVCITCSNKTIGDLGWIDDYERNDYRKY